MDAALWNFKTNRALHWFLLYRIFRMMNKSKISTQNFLITGFTDILFWNHDAMTFGNSLEYVKRSFTVENFVSKNETELETYATISLYNKMRSSNPRRPKVARNSNFHRKPILFRLTSKRYTVIKSGVLLQSSRTEDSFRKARRPVVTVVTAWERTRSLRNCMWKNSWQSLGRLNA